MSDWYYLDEQHNVCGPIEISDPRFRESRMFKNRVVAKTQVYDGCNVSTVFLGLDHGYRPGDPPIVFETMVFGGPFDQDQERYATWDEAVAGHARWVKKCQPIMTEDAR